MFFQLNLLDFVKKTATDGHGWMGLPNPGGGSGEPWRLSLTGRPLMLGRMLPGHLFDTGLTANRSLSLAQNYVLALLITPFDVVETLRELQFQPRFEVIKREIGTKTHTWFGKKESNYIPLLHRGTWESVREIVEFPKGGAIVLIRGHFTKLIYRFLYTQIQDYSEETLNEIFNIYKQTDTLTCSLSHLVVSYALYPIDAIRTCLMLQSASWDKKSYQGPIHMLYSAIRHNSKKFLKLYDPRICWVPTVVNALGPVLHYLSGMIISKLFRLNSRTDGILYYLARAGFLALESVILSPLHLIKKRLEIQTVMKYHPNEIDEHEQRHQPGADSGKSLDLFDFHPSVFIYPERYTGIIDCLAKTISLEGNGVPSIPDPQTIPLRYSADRQKNISKILQHSNLSREPFERKFQDYISISGVKSMFRGFWCLYLNKIILFSLEEINRKPDVLPWHNI